MNRILLFCALGALFGCRQATAPSGEAITLCYSTSEPSKTDALTEGDKVMVFARIDGTEHYFLEAAKFITGSDGKTLTAMPAVHYPETKQAINFYAYFGGAWDGGQGTCSVPSDQSTATALKKADLCWASASSTPVPTPVSLTFQHLFARLIVHTNKPTSKIACQVVPSGTLNPATGEFTLNSTKSEVSTTKNELIVPVQPLSRLVLTVGGIDYVFEGSINLQSGQTTTINLTLNPSTQTATLNGSSTTDWMTSNQNGTPTEAVSNVLTLHWTPAHARSSEVNKVVLTIDNVDYTVSSGVTYGNGAFIVPLSSSNLIYPYTLQKIGFYTSNELIQSCHQLLGPTIYHSGVATLGIKDPANAVWVKGLWWATGNLVADGPNGCKIGAPTDAGLHFGYGSLVGWSGGANGDGRGQGVPSTVARVTPTTYSGSMSYIGPWYSDGPVGTNYCYPSTDNPSTGIGDPCRYYIGPQWRTPTYTDWRSMPVVASGSLAACGFTYVASTPNYCYLNSCPDLIFNMQSGMISHGSIYQKPYLWSSSRTSNRYGYYTYFYDATDVVFGHANGGTIAVGVSTYLIRCCMSQ